MHRDTSTRAQSMKLNPVPSIRNLFSSNRRSTTDKVEPRPQISWPVLIHTTYKPRNEAESNVALPPLKEQQSRLNTFKVTSNRTPSATSSPSSTDGEDVTLRRSLIRTHQVAVQWEAAIGFVGRGKYEDAQQGFLDLITQADGGDQSSMKFHLWMNIGLLYAARGEHTLARDMFWRALRGNIRNPLPYFLIGIQEYTIEDFEAAKSSFKECLKWMVDIDQGWSERVSLQERDFRQDGLDFVLRKGDILENMRKCDRAAAGIALGILPEDKPKLKSLPVPSLFNVPPVIQSPVLQPLHNITSTRAPFVDKEGDSDLSSGIRSQNGTSDDEYTTQRTSRSQFDPRPAPLRIRKRTSSIYSQATRLTQYDIDSRQASIREPAPLSKMYLNGRTPSWSDISHETSFATLGDHGRRQYHSSVVYPGKGEILHNYLHDLFGDSDPQPEDEPGDNEDEFEWLPRPSPDVFVEESSGSSGSSSALPPLSTVSTLKLFDTAFYQTPAPLAKASNRPKLNKLPPFGSRLSTPGSPVLGLAYSEVAAAFPPTNLPLEIHATLPSSLLLPTDLTPAGSRKDRAEPPESVLWKRRDYWMPWSQRLKVREPGVITWSSGAPRLPTRKHKRQESRGQELAQKQAASPPFQKRVQQAYQPRYMTYEELRALDKGGTP